MKSYQLRRAVAWISFQVLFLFSLASARSAEVQLSFLTGETTLAAVLPVLETNGFSPAVVSSFARVVRDYNTSPAGLPIPKFPKAINGTFHFESGPNLVASLSGHPFEASTHHYHINCFDTVLLLLSDSLKTKLSKDSKFKSPILVPGQTEDGKFLIRSVNTPEAAVSSVYLGWYSEFAANLLPEPVLATRAALTSALFRFHRLPDITREKDLERMVLAILKQSWRAQGLEFPQEAKMVLCHEINFHDKLFTTAHAGIIIQNGSMKTYLEKSGGSGPFIRIDYTDEEDLRVWLSAMFKGASRLGYTHHFMTINDSVIRKLDFEK